MKRTTYKGFVIDRDNLGRLYIYNTKSPYSEDSDRNYNCGNSIKSAKEKINYIIEKCGMPIGKYDYEDLVSKALSAKATQKDINNLGKWFDRYGSMYWNGEYYEIDSNHNLFPVIEVDEDGECKTVGWEVH